MAFDALTASGTMWLHSDYLALISTLLSNGASGESVHFALANALTYVIEGGASTELLELLLKYHADINFDNGKSLQLATYHGRQDLFKLLLLHGDPNPLSIYMSLQAALSNNLEEETVFQLFKSVTANKSMQTEPDVNNSSDLGLPLIFYCLENYPKSARLAKEICSLHADLSLTVTQKFHLDECNNPLFEQIPPLLFALERNCSDEVIQVLIDHCGMPVQHHFQP
jgi:ankyrin repeat protein